ncbi:hypothetical protein LTR17_005682 [Elasticomyces elasticus]|nr:hypothetical protein LTR17_005682 [Elasticomyces elasticus]
MDVNERLTNSPPKYSPYSLGRCYVCAYAGKLKGKVTIFTGASVGLGLGRYVAKAYAAAGSSVAYVARREADLKLLVEEIKQAGRHAITIVADVAEGGAPKRIVSQTESELGPVDILVVQAWHLQCP